MNNGRPLFGVKGLQLSRCLSSALSNLFVVDGYAICDCILILGLLNEKSANSLPSNYVCDYIQPKATNVLWLVKELFEEFFKKGV